jgi:hypothetical protein
MRIFLHIGTNKTGTTAIQDFLERHQRSHLLRRKYLYPVTGRHGIAHYKISQTLGFSRTSNRPDDALCREIVSELTRELQSHGAKTAIISSEDFVLPGSAARVASVFRDFDVRVVLYLRRHDHWWASSYSQAVRMVVHPPWEPGLHGYFRNRRTKIRHITDYRQLADKWSAAFGRDQMIVRPYEKEQNHGGVVADFLRCTGLEELAEIAARQTERPNRSPGLKELHVLDLVQRANIRESLRKKLLTELVARGRQEHTGGSFPPSLRHRLIKSNLPDYSYIAKHYLHRADGVLFREMLPALEMAGSEAGTPPSAEEVVSHLLRVVDNLV